MTAAAGPDLATVRGAALRLLATGRVAALILACTWYPGKARPRPHIRLIDALLTADE